MYVCICHAVTEKDIHKAVKQGICSMKMLSEAMAVSSQCGSCNAYACQVLQEALNTHSYSNNNISCVSNKCSVVSPIKSNTNTSLLL